MKRFIIKIGFFTIFLILYFFLNAIINYLIISETEPEVNKSDIIIMGDSHPQTALFPAVFHDAENISQSAEPLILTYWKAKYLLSKFDADTLIIGIGHHNIAGYNDLKFTNEEWSYEMFKRSYPIENLEKLDGKLEIDYLAYFETLWRETGFYPKKNHFNFIGNFRSSLKHDISDSLITIKRHFYSEGVEEMFSETSISHIDSIINVCESKKVVPIVVVCPVHQSYYRKIPQKNKDIFNEILLNLKARGVKVIEKSLVPYPDTYFLDATHLNKKGAFLFSKEIKNLLNPYRKI